jgi:serine protease Do
MTSMRPWAAVAATVLCLAACRKGDLPDGMDPVERPAPTAATPLPAITAPPSRDPAPAVPLVPASFAPIARRADPSVVTINTVTDEEPSLFPGHRRLRRMVKGLGTGFIFDKDGLILTNHHVIAEADSILVKLYNEKAYPARVVGKDPRTDIAVVKIDEKGLTPLALGDSDAIEVGDWVVAIGNPYNLSHTVSAGILSAKGRTHDDVPLPDPTGYYSFLQTDASINPGNSGGPLLDMKGDVVGINTAINKEGKGLAFAIPINMVKTLLPMLVRDGHVTRSALGVSVRDVRALSPEDRADLKVTTDHGAFVYGVTLGGPADKAKIAFGDIIVAFEGTVIDRNNLLPWLASTAGVGRTVALRILREGKELEIKVKLGQLQEPQAAGNEPQGGPDPFGGFR